ncbi:MAG: helix-turn-helix domain-containing protein [Streptosporangiaceae bacterium]
MRTAGVRVGVGTRFVYDGETVEVVRVAGTAAGMEVVAADSRGRLLRLGLKELLLSERARVIPDGPGPSAADEDATAGVRLSQLTAAQRDQVLERAGHVREVLTGYRSGSAELAQPGEPRQGFAPVLPLEARYAAKAAELGAGVRTVKRWVSRFRQLGEAGLAPAAGGVGPLGGADERWVQTALEVMAEHTGESKPSRKMVIERTAARLAAACGDGAVPLPSRTTAYRLLEELERRQPTFRLSAKRNQDIAARPVTAYGKLRPTRPGEYLLMDTTRLDVFALDPVTLRWLQAELTVAMDWYDRCVTGLRLTPVSTKAVDAAATLYQAFRPRPAAPGWPAHAVWPEHGIPRTVLVDRQAIIGPAAGAASPALVPETLVIDHGKIYVGEHLTSVCRRLGISIQPARLRTGRDKGPVERFFRTLREDLLQALPGYKGPDVHSRGSDPEGGAFFFLDELEAIIREWVAVVYHHRPHEGLADPGVPGLALSPAAMFEHGIARAGYIEVPRDPDLAFEFLKVEWRSIQHYGVEIGSRRYNGAALDAYRNQRSGHPGGSWPFHLDPDDITRVYFRDPAGRCWHALSWEHAASAQMPLSEDALAFARRLAASKYRYPDDRLALASLLERWNLGLGTTLAERRMALRMSRQHATFDLPEAAESVTALPSLRRALDAGESPADPAGPEQAPDGGDDDEGDLDAADAGDDYYADALEDV